MLLILIVNTMKLARKPRKKHRAKSRQRGSINRGVTVEIGLKLILSWSIAIAAIASLCRLVPYHLSQQAKLDELRLQVGETEARVERLRKQLNDNFDPQKTQSLMEEYSSLSAPNQSRIYWLPESEVDNTQESEKIEDR